MPGIVTPNGHGLGWRAQSPDPRDHLLAASPRVLRDLPPKVDLRDEMPPVWEQGEIASCTAHAIAALVQHQQKKQGLKEFTPSRLMIYYNERAMENSVNSDSGAMLRDGIKTVVKDGACREKLWPYVTSKWAQKPPSKCYTEATKYKALAYKSIIRDLQEFKACLASGFPFALGISLFESFESPEAERTGKIPMPAHGEKHLGGHAVVCVGYDDALQSFIFRNSWSENWGEQGYFYLYYQYLLNKGLSRDFWAIPELAV